MKIHFISISLTFTSCIVITFSFSYHHTFTTSWLRQKKISLLIIKLISQLRSLRHDLRVKIFFFFITYYVHYAMIKRKPFFFISALRSIRHCYRKRNLIFIEPLLWLRYDYEKIVLFYFTGTFTMEISSYMIFHRSLHH